MSDKALHGVWVKLSSVLAELQANGGNLSDLNQSGSSGSGSVSGVDSTTFSDKVTNVLSSLGITVAKGVTSIATLTTKNFSTDTATVKYLQMVASNGDTYCTWLDENGDWQKVKGNCSDVAVVATAATAMPDPNAVVQQAQQATQDAQDATQQATQAAQNLSDIASQAQQVLQNAQQTANDAVNQVVQQATPQVVSQATQALAGKTNLDSAIKTAQGETQASYTSDSWQALQTALTAAQTVDANTSAIQSDVDTATTNLNSAISGLVPQTGDNSSSVNGAIENSASSLLNGMWKFLNWLFAEPIKKLFKVN